MSDAPRSSRSFETIERDDLARLVRLAQGEIASVCRDGNKSSVYRDRCLLLCLCQGAALQLQQQQAGVPVEEQHGIHDFDVWAFFEEHPDLPFPPRWRAEVDFGTERFGRRPEDTHFVGRKVDVIGRSIPVPQGETAIQAVTGWISTDNPSPRAIRQRPVYVISLGSDFGRQIWPDP